MADLKAMNKDDFSTIGAFVHEFKRKARKVHEISEETQWAIFLGLFTGSEAAELASHGGGSEKLTWATIDKGVEEGSLDQVEQHQMRLQRRKRKERDATASGTPGVKTIVTDVLAALGYDNEAEVQKRGVTVAQGRASGAVDAEAGREDYGGEETGSLILTKAQRKQRNLLMGGQGSGKGQAPQAIAAVPPAATTAPAPAGAMWQEKEDPAIRIEEIVGDSEEVTQRLKAGTVREEPIVVESDEDEREPTIVILEKMEDLLGKVGRKEVVEVPEEEEADDDEEDERLRQEENRRAELRARKRGAQEEAEPSLPDSVPKRKKYVVRMEEGFDMERMVDKLLEGHNDLMNLKDILASAPRLRGELKGRLSRRLVPNVHLSTILPREVEWTEVGTMMDWKCVAFGKVDLVIKNQKCTGMVDTGAEMNIIREKEAVMLGMEIDRPDHGMLHGVNCKAAFCGTASNVIIEIRKMRARTCFFVMPDVDHSILLGRSFLCRTEMLIFNKHDGTMILLLCDPACGNYEQGSQRRYKTINKKSRPVPVLVTEDEEAYYERERGLIRRMQERALAGPCRISSENEGELIVGEPGFLSPQEKALMVETMKKRHRAYAFNDDERGRLDVDKIPIIQIHTVPHEPWDLRGTRYPNPDEEKKVVDYLDGKMRTHVADYSSGPYVSPWFCFIKPNGTLRWVQNLQRLNAVTLWDAGGLPNADALSESCAGRPIISLIDVYYGYDQFPVYPPDRPVMAMHTPRGLIHMNVAPQGWTNAVAMVQRHMIKVMQTVSPHITQPYIDDLAIKGPKEKEEDEVMPGVRRFVWKHVRDIDQVLSLLEEHNLTTSGPKSKHWNKNRADGLSRINWDGSDQESIEDTPPVDGFLDQEEDVRLHINEWSLRVPSCVSHPIWLAPKGYEQKEELVLKPFQEEDPWGSKDVGWMMKLALAGTHSLAKEVRTIEECPTQVEEHEQLIGGMYLLTNTLLQGSFDQRGSFSPEESEIVVPESQDDKFEEGEIREAFRAKEYDWIYWELGLLLSCEIRDWDASAKAQKMRHQYIVRDGHLFIKRQVGNPKRIVCGRNHQIDIIAALHDGIVGGHRGIGTTCAKISELYHWDGMLTMVIKYCQSCIPCQERSDFSKAVMQRGRRDARSRQGPQRAPGRDEHNRPPRREPAPEFDDDNIELFLDVYRDHAVQRGWSVAERIQHLRGIGRFEEPIAPICEKTLTWPDVEAGMQRLRASPMGRDGMPIQLEERNEEEFVPAYEHYMLSQGIAQEGWMQALLIWTRRAERTVARQIRDRAKDWEHCQAQLRQVLGRRERERPEPRVERRRRSKRPREPVPRGAKVAREGRRAPARREDEPMEPVPEEGSFPAYGLKPVEFRWITSDGLRPPSPPLPGPEQVVPGETPFRSLVTHLDVSRWEASQLGEGSAEPVQYVPIEEPLDPEAEVDIRGRGEPQDPEAVAEEQGLA
ncbi:hypothetical protein CBR_g37284 [Chara braunii]|uniref:Uncharacterized protein n=1 Tax=Chara braunii TaxID=69332 RepID=A0A388LMJ8_CHABU|nr:hypothetical protein CBR_g37284 [Chara braunii]|eukprot:GBG83566.1 hypothetical protein CBR_g37284 [Chara braunii]